MKAHVFQLTSSSADEAERTDPLPDGITSPQSTGVAFLDTPSSSDFASNLVARGFETLVGRVGLRQQRTSPRRFEDERDRVGNIAFDELCFDAKDANAVQTNELRIAARIGEPVCGMNAAIDFDDELVSRAVEIDDVRSEHVLTTPPNAEAIHAERVPELTFGRRGMLAHLAGEEWKTR